MNELSPDDVRSSIEIAHRSLSLFGVVGIALGAPQETIVEWLRDEGLLNDLSPLELAYISAQEPTEKQMINFSWRSEALIVLIWAIGKIEKLPPTNEQCDTSLFQELLPPFAEISVKEFIQSAVSLSEETLLKKADEIMHLHWEARDARLNSKAVPPHVDIEIIQERHHAIYWVIGYDGLPWDEVTTDT